MTATQMPSTMSSRALLRGFAAAESLPEFSVNGLASDSREIGIGYLFIALAGLTHHALDFTANAVRDGAAAVVYDADDSEALRRIPLLRKQFPIHWIAVSDLPQHCGEIASRFFGEPSRAMNLIGVTGTDGKTSVTHLLVQALTRLGRKAGSIGTLGYGVNNHLQATLHTTPDAIRLQRMLGELRQQGCEDVVMEVSSHALEQYRTRGCQFDIAVFTNLGSDHLDFHDTQERYAAAKSLLFESGELKARVLNIRDPFGRQLSERDDPGIGVTYSTSLAYQEQVDIRLLGAHVATAGLLLEIETRENRVKIQTGLIGEFNADNCLACFGVLQQLGYAGERIAAAMQGLHSIPGRMEYLPATANQSAVVIDFAHTAQALEACLQALHSEVAGRLYCVFGCGGDRDAGKRPEMAAVAERLADVVLVTDDNPRHEAPETIVRDILVGFRQPDEVRVIHDRRAAIATVLAEAGPADLVVVAGKGHESVQIVGDRRIPFSDRQVVLELRAEASS